jgi:hypothetical protein
VLSIASFMVSDFDFEGMIRQSDSLVVLLRVFDAIRCLPTNSARFMLDQSCLLTRFRRTQIKNCTLETCLCAKLTPNLFSLVRIVDDVFAFRKEYINFYS